MSDPKTHKSSLLQKLKQRALGFKRDIWALYYAYRDPRVPWYGKVVIAGVLAYAFSPIDLIPDFVPVLGYLDDLILLPLLVIIALKIIPAPVMTEAREKAISIQRKPKNRAGAILIIGAWLTAAVMIIRFVIQSAR